MNPSVLAADCTVAAVFALTAPFASAFGLGSASANPLLLDVLAYPQAPLRMLALAALVLTLASLWGTLRVNSAATLGPF